MFRNDKAIYRSIFLVIAITGSMWADDSTGIDAPDSVPSGQLIEGIVLDHNGGGIADARVRIESLDAGPDTPPLAEGTTNQLGDISIRFLEQAKTTLRVRILREGYVEFVTEIDLTDEDYPPFIDATLEGAARLTGTIRLVTKDQPPAEAKIRCDNGGRERIVSVDTDGRFIIDNVDRGLAVLTVHADGCAIERQNVKIEAEETNVEIDLYPERPVMLTVKTNHGEPADDVFVEAITHPTQQYFSAKTDAGGKATLHGISPETEYIRLRLNGDRYELMSEYEKTISTFAPPVTTQPIKIPPVTEHFTVTVAARARGKVTDAQTNGPIVGVRVIAGRQIQANMPMVWTALDGTYELGGIRPGIVTLSFQHADYATAIREVDLHTNATVPVDVQLDTGQPIAGVVINEQGMPISQVWITCEKWQGYATLGLRTITGEDGKFSFPHTPSGEIEFSFVRSGSGPEHGRPHFQTLTAGKRDYRITLADQPPSDESAECAGKIEVGENVPELSMTAIDGKIYKLSELRGKYVFLDFWASWCGPCVAEIPNVKALYKATKDRADFILIGVSLDTQRDAFDKAVKVHQMVWPQIFGPKSGADEAFETLEGVGIPYTCLIGPDGKMITQHLRGPSLTEEVQKNLPKSN